MKIELFLDEDVHSGLAHALRKRGYDAIHAQELERKGRSDNDEEPFRVLVNFHTISAQTCPYPTMEIFILSTQQPISLFIYKLIRGICRYNLSA